MITATVDIGDVEKGLEAMRRRARQLGPVFQALKGPMRVDQKEHRTAKAGPDGAWAPRSAATLASKHHRRLARSILGRLPTAVSYKATGNSLVAESRVKWSGVHQDGGIVGRGAKIPARPFLWLSSKLLDIAVDVIDRALITAYGGR